MLTLPNGHSFDFVASAGALGFDGDDSGHGFVKLWKKPFRWLGLLNPKEFVIVTKTLTAKPRIGNLTLFRPWRCVRFFHVHEYGSSGIINAVGLTNPGLSWWMDNCYERMTNKYRTILSISPADAEEAGKMAQSIVWNCHKILAIQVNLSCPNTGKSFTLNEATDILAALKRCCGIPIIAKLSYDNYLTGMVGFLKGFVDAIEMINAVPWGTVYPSIPSPLVRYGLTGAVSGKPIRYLSQIALRGSVQHGIPIISGGGIYTADEAKNRFALGASACALGTIFLTKPWLPNRIVRDCRHIEQEAWAKECEKIDRGGITGD